MSKPVKPDAGSMSAPPSDRETERLAALERYGVLDTAAETGFDDLARLAAQICGTPVGLITFVDDVRQFFKARAGFDGGPVAPLDEGFCPIVVRDAATLIIPDAQADPAHAANAAVTIGGVRFYAGVPLTTPDGHVLGTICVMDQAPRALTPEQQAGLDALASQVISQLELHRALRRASQEGARAEREAARAAEQARRLALLAHASARLLTATDATEMVRDLYASVASTFRLDVCLNYACQDDGLGLVASAGLTPEQAALAARLEFGQTICGMVGASQEPVHVTGIQLSDDLQAALLKMLGLDTYACTPLLADGELLGTLAFGRRAGPFSDGELEVLRTLVSYAAIALHKLRSTLRLAATARRQAFLVELGDRLRDLDEPADLSFAAAEIIGRALGVSRAGYGTVDPVAETLTIERDWNAPGVESLAGMLRFRDYGSYIEDLRRGETVLVADAETDPRTSATADALMAISARAVVNMPVTEQGDLVAVLYLTHATAREWMADELAFVHEVAERTRTAVERRRAERDLRELAASLERQIEERTAELRLHRDIVQSDRSPVCAFDESYRLIAFNQAHSDEFHRIFGHRVQLGEVFPDLFLPDQAPVIRAFMARALAGESYTVVEEFGDPELSKPYWEVSYYPLRNEAGRIIGAFHHARDISARLRAEAELATAQEALRQSQKMEAVGQLTGGLAHDFNNLLAGITGSLELMQARMSQGRVNDLQRYITAAQGAAKRAAALTHRLLAFTRRQTLDPRPIDMNRLVSGMEELIGRTVGPQVTVEVLAAAGLWTTLVDPNQLENALLNLCINARDAMPDGGRLTIETGNRGLDERTARARDLLPGQYVSLCVSDTGTGMTPEVVRRAFEPFFTTKPIGMGTGLGLSMIYGFVQQSGGQARIHSEPGQGATVCLYLPRHLGAVQSADESADPAEAPRAEAGETVLVVDDEPTVRMLVTEALDDLGYMAIEAADGTAGLQVLRSDVRVDLLVTDVGLPGMNGRQVADAGRALRPGLKVLFITGYAENAVLNHSHLDPGMQVLTKPFAMETLASRIKHLIAGM